MEIDVVPLHAYLPLGVDVVVVNVSQQLSTCLTCWVGRACVCEGSSANAMSTVTECINGTTPSCACDNLPAQDTLQPTLQPTSAPASWLNPRYTTTVQALFIVQTVIIVGVFIYIAAVVDTHPTNFWWFLFPLLCFLMFVLVVVYSDALEDSQEALYAALGLFFLFVLLVLSACLCTMTEEAWTSDSFFDLQDSTGDSKDKEKEKKRKARQATYTNTKLIWIGFAFIIFACMFAIITMHPAVVWFQLVFVIGFLVLATIYSHTLLCSIICAVIFLFAMTSVMDVDLGDSTNAWWEITLFVVIVIASVVVLWMLWMSPPVLASGASAGAHPHPQPQTKPKLSKAKKEEANAKEKREA